MSTTHDNIFSSVTKSDMLQWLSQHAWGYHPLSMHIGVHVTHSENQHEALIHMWLNNWRNCHVTLLATTSVHFSRLHSVPDVLPDDALWRHKVFLIIPVGMQAPCYLHPAAVRTKRRQHGDLKDAHLKSSTHSCHTDRDLGRRNKCTFHHGHRNCEA